MSFNRGMIHHKNQIIIDIPQFHYKTDYASYLMTIIKINLTTYNLFYLEAPKC